MIMAGDWILAISSSGLASASIHCWRGAGNMLA
jgi:hypothetical protein